MRIMSVFKKVLAVVVILLVALYLIGFALPSKYEVSRSIEIDGSDKDIFYFVIELREWKKWGVWFERDPKMRVEYSGRPMNVGYKSSWLSESQGNGEMTITKIEPFSLMTYDLYFPDMDMTSIGTIELESKEGKTKVTWRDTGDMGSNIMGRYFILMIDGMLGPDFEAGLANLKKLVEERK